MNKQGERQNLLTMSAENSKLKPEFLHEIDALHSSSYKIMDAINILQEASYFRFHFPKQQVRRQGKHGQ